MAGAISLVTGLSVDGLDNIFIAGASSKMAGDYTDTSPVGVTFGTAASGYIVASATGPLNNWGTIIRRRAFPGFIDLPAPSVPAQLSPFLEDFPPQEQIGTCPALTTCTPEVTPLGDIPLGVAGTTSLTAIPPAVVPDVTVTNGAANGVGNIDTSSNTACFGGFVSQKITELGASSVRANQLRHLALGLPG